MATPRPPDPSKRKEKASAPPSLPGRTMGLLRARGARIAARALIACAVVGVLTVLAQWHASGLIRRGEIPRMMRMGATPVPSIPESKPRGRLDRARLEAMAAAAAR